jgi:hypothetical protein
MLAYRLGPYTESSQHSTPTGLTYAEFRLQYLKPSRSMRVLCRGDDDHIMYRECFFVKRVIRPFGCFEFPKR